MKLLVTDAETRAALALTRSLGRAHRVHVCAAGRRPLAGASRFAAAEHPVSDPLASPEAFADEIAALVRDEGIELVLPVSDAATSALQRRREALAPARLVAAAPDAYTRLSDKAALAKLAHQVGLEAPPGERAGDAQAALAIATRIGFPVVVKPVLSVVRDAQGRLHKPEVIRADTPAALADAFARAAASGEALVQHCVAGWGEGLSLLRSEGRTLAVFAHRRLREKPPGGGVSVLAESIAVDAVRLARTEGLIDAAGYEGLVMAEFKTDGRRAFLIECNARPWGSLQLAIDAGVDFPRLLVALAAGARVEPVRGYRTGVRLRWELGDLDHALALGRGRAGPDGRSGLRAALGSLLRPTGARWELLRSEDPRPFARALAGWFAGRSA